MTRTLTTSVSPSLLAFKPRQVLLSRHTTKKANDIEAPMSAIKAVSLDPEQRTLLLHAVSLFLQRNGFSKTLKKFRSEAQIEKDFSKDLSLSLEEMCHMHLKKCTQAIATPNKPVDEETVKEGLDDRAPEAQEEPTKKSKDKKKIKKAVAETHVDIAENEKSDSVQEEARKKSKDKKKKKNKENVATVEENVVKSKKKKKKDGRLLSDENSNQLMTRCSEETLNESDGIKTPHEEEHNDKSKKRKRLASEDLDSHTVDQNETEDIKRRKLEGSEGCNDGVQSTKVNTSNELSQQTNEYVEKTAEKTSSKKALKKHSNGSAEPKTFNAFQRVKVDAVTFSDDKLADNSYWAKDGAETGYGAKAQEVLGQVKGRDFRHEKTKKKRGSYRGGVIDLQSHSVKFNYSDDD
ncbi:nucleolar and coiled-body phosphoprotein 1 isoform X1 [Cucurbita pepo subsp. pepo]|uniref:nucleolar and coiled-body phosphoprotein 1 isoform X1 n=1 Tax=Cucurbita pepo subsp. pepo TaxID=3664 RepID=UPI000C9D795A|nr:nucleolar and coiled-body phosphoprotein 1 isoform X1 [Cucurbita pepo subsp. pepo]